MKKFINFLKITGWIILGIASIVATIFVILNYFNIQESKDLEETPFFKYEYSKEKDAFEIISGEDFDIKNIRWILPIGHNYPAPALSTSLYEISENSTILTINDIENALLEDLNSFLEIDIEHYQLYDLVRCRIFPLIASQYSRSSGLSIIVEVEYVLRGENKPLKTIDLIYIKGLNVEFPVIETISRNASNDEINNFATESTALLNNAFKIVGEDPNTKVVTNDGECAVHMGNPDLEQEYKKLEE